MELAHVAEPAELATHADLYFAAAPHHEAISALAAPMVRRLALDHEVHGLDLVTSAKETREALRTLGSSLKSTATRTVRQQLGHPGGNFEGMVHWCAPLGIWALFGESDETMNHFFGTQHPDRSKSIQITVKATVPREGINRKLGAAIAADRATGRYYVVHRGRIGGGRQGIGADLFWSRFRGGTSMREPGRDEPARVVIMGEVGAPTLARDVAAFVHEVGRIKAAGA